MVNYDGLEREIYENSRYTSATCKDSGRLVIRRAKLAEILSRELVTLVTVKTFNQLVAMVSLVHPRRPYTINSASRSKYILVEDDTAMMVLRWILENKDKVITADMKAEQASLAGLQYKRGLLKSKKHKR